MPLAGNWRLSEAELDADAVSVSKELNWCAVTIGLFARASWDNAISFSLLMLSGRRTLFAPVVA